MPAMVQTSTVVKASLATATAGVVAYAIYFDYMRRRSSEFRHSLRKNEKRMARAQKEEAETAVQQKRQRVKLALMQALAQGFPTDVTQKEAYFMEQVSVGEQLSTNPDAALEAAMGFYKALKVYPTPSDLIRIYDQTVPKHVLDILAEIIALDQGLSSSSLFGPSPAVRARAAAAAAAGGVVEDVSGAVDSDPEEVDPEAELADVVNEVTEAAKDGAEILDKVKESAEENIDEVVAEAKETVKEIKEQVNEQQEEEVKETGAQVEATVEEEEEEEEEAEVIEKDTESDEGVQSLASSIAPEN